MRCIVARCADLYRHPSDSLHIREVPILAVVLALLDSLAARVSLTRGPSLVSVAHPNPEDL